MEIKIMMMKFRLYWLNSDWAAGSGGGCLGLIFGSRQPAQFTAGSSNSMTSSPTLKRRSAKNLTLDRVKIVVPSTQRGVGDR